MKSLIRKYTDALHVREKRLLYASVSSAAVKATTILSSILTLPFILSSIGSERYGMLLTITSMAALINFADLGLGFGLQNKIAHLAQKSKQELRKAISSTFAFLVCSSIAILLIFSLINNSILWGEVLHLKSKTAIDEANVSVWFFVICFTVSIPFSIVQKIQIGLQEGYYTNLWTICGNLFSLVFIYLCYEYIGSTPLFIIAIYGSNAFFILLNFIHQFIWKRPDISPQFRLADFSVVRSIISDSLSFFIVQLTGLLLFASNNMFLISYAGPEAVSDFNVGYKLALLFLIPLEASAPYLTPTVNEATLTGDYYWVNKIVVRTITLAVLLAFVSAALIYTLGNQLIHFWVGGDIVLSEKTLVSIAMFMLLYANMGCLVSYIMLSNTFIKYKVLLYTFSVGITIGIKYICIKNYGIPGAFWSTSVPMFLLYILPSLYLLKSKRVL
ncbi:oligosaccharide flippase family protein [Rudanella paleaurantiibacter]|uniref:Oligosaccharide flippase family protein n=1 Tax=Rudanella paleaurantiibacter TaxID=2614655 RepID=A0A7J5TXI7_9BACT|nr:oligosaccharide flippase family protein [Rudanella paleaurantiibacter]KAB7729358.1 oligosaccharide flippase family protein [Rudanella paleaurantiibacter]